MDKGHQHVIPECYQKSWLAPDCPANFEPYIWRISKDGTTKKNKAPHNAFVEKDKYTIHLTDGTRDLVVENTLMQTEDAFMAVLPKIKAERDLDALDWARLCIFLSAMQARTNVMGNHWSKFFGDLHKLVVKSEKAHNAPPVTSLETEHMARYAHQQMVQATLQVLPQMLFRMSMAILVTDDKLGFITSDTPVHLNDPDAHKRPPGLRSPSLSRPRIEVTMPLTPRHMLVITHSGLQGYVAARQKDVDELNRMSRYSCLEYFISLTGDTKPFWFEKYVAPADAWENTPEGKSTLEREQRFKERAERWKKEYEAQKRG